MSIYGLISAFTDWLWEFPIVKDTTPDITILRLYITSKQERTFFERYVPVLIICIAYHHNTVSFR